MTTAVNIARKSHPFFHSPPQLHHLSTAAAVAPWYKPPPSSNHKLQSSSDPILNTLSEAIKHSDTKPLETSLRKLLPSLKPRHIIQLINLNPNSLSPQSLYSFFAWLSSHSHSTGYRHTLHSYCTMVHFLCSHKMLLPVQGLIGTIISRKGKNSASSVFEAILETRGNHRSNLYGIFDRVVNAYLDIGHFDDAMQCCKMIKEHKFQLPFQGCLRILDYLIKFESAVLAWNFYKEILECGFPSDLICFNKLMHKLCKEDQIMEAQEVFDEIGRRFRPSVVSFNTLISGYCRSGNLREGFRLKKGMEEIGVLPDVYTYSGLINGLCRVSALSDSIELFNEMCTKGLVPNDVTFTTLIDGHCKNGMIDMAIKIYQQMMRQGIAPDLITYNTLVDGLCKVGDLREARSLVDEMITKGLKPDKVTYTSLIDGLCKVGDLDAAMGVRNGMCKEGIKLDDVTYTALITGLCRQGQLLEAENLLGEMLSVGFKPDDAIYTMVIDGFCKEGNVKKGFKLLRDMQSDGHIPSVVTYNVLMNGLCKLGQMKNANMLLHAMLNLGVCPDDITYNILLEGHCQCGNPEDIDKLRSEKGLILDYGSYSALVSTLSKSSKHRYQR
ncbi:hypothetical protein M9H77_34105 [Catharanthus roseus]|uniref:Uncharacterized protein n=1 Tax=Catharanthus roseus TaxID=4058 RepID=A0ACB9ZNU9_CATRO|nr:hypothetical protein M9H77_34105 [Catharanthus roseus]